MSDVVALYPLTPAQQGMLFHALEEPGSDLYVQQLVCTLRGEVDVAALELAWQDVAGQHAALRTELVWEDVERPLQVVRATGAIPVVVAEGPIEDVTRRERAKGFDLASGPLCRVAVVRDGADTHLVWTHHHIVLDGWSLPLVMRDLFAAYAARASGRVPVLAEPPSYKPYAAWLRERTAHAAASDALFARMLEGIAAPTPLPCETRARAANGAAPHASRELALSAADSQAIVAYARRAGATLAAVLGAAWALILRRHAGRGDVVFGVTLGGRPTEVQRAGDLVGMFVNTLPLRVRFAEGTTAPAIVAAVQEGLVALQENQHRALADVQRLSAVPPGQPLFESLVVVENYPTDAALGATATFRVEDVRTVERISYPLALVCSPASEAHPEMGLRLLYDGARFEGAAVEALLARLRVVLRALAQGFTGNADAVPLVEEDERRALAARRSRAASFPVTTTLDALFAARAAEHGGRVAVVCDDRRVTYAELARRATAFADALRERGVAPGARVALCLDRSVDMVAAVLGILEVGAAYVPLDPVHPAERLRWTTEDAGATALLTSRAEDPYAGSATLPVVYVEDVATAQAAPRRATSRATPDDAAYVLYTSGSTGRPKGVVVTHANVARLFTATDAWFRFGPDDVFTLFHSIAFDFSVWELFGALLHGGRLVVVPRRVTRAPDELRALLAREGVTVLNQTPSAFEQLVIADARDESPLALRTVVFGGEALSVDRLAPWFARHGDETPRLVNMYGITETTVHVTYRPIRAADVGVAARRGASPIGRPIPDLTVQILDASGEPAPVGVPGEIYVGGAGVARGYHAREALDRERFLWDRGGARLYRSGDVGRYVADDEIEFLGRADDQIKIRGHRVEPGEIEATLLAREDVQACAVALRDDGAGPRLVAYVVPHPAADPARLGALLRDHLGGRLPEPMIPSAFVLLAALPLTANGKLDRAALPAPSAADVGMPDESPRRRARDPLEEIVTRAWARVLRDDALGPDDDVFARGAHSLLVTQVGSRLRASTGQEVALRALFEHPTPARLADHLRARAGDGRRVPPITHVADEGAELPLSFAQQRLYFLDRLARGTDTGHASRSVWTIPLAARLRGSLDEAALRRTLAGVVQRHPALRTAFGERDGVPVQRVLPSCELPLTKVDLRGASDRDHAVRAAAEAEIARPFDLTAPPLLRAALLALDEDDHVLVLSAHHIVADGWSLAVLLRDLVALYTGREDELPPLPVTVADHAAWQRRWFDETTLEDEVAYFREHLAGAPPLLDLPTDRPRPRLPTYAAGELRFVLEADVAAALDARARDAGATLSMMLLAVLHALVARWAGQDDVTVGVSIAGRTRAELEDLVGFFVNLLVVRARPAADVTFGELLASVRAASLGAYAHQDVPFEQVVDALRPARSLAHAPLFQVNFVYQNLPLEQLWSAAHAGPTGSGTALALEAVRLPVETARFDLVLTLEEPAGGPLRATLTYARDLFDEATARAFAEQYAALARAVVEDDDVPLGTLSLGAPAAHASPEAPAAPTEPLHALVAARAATRPDAPAVTHGSRVVTYREMVGRAHHVARELRAAGVGEGARVAIAMDRSPERIVAILAVLAAGGAFVPVEPSLPLDRRARLLERSGAAVVLVDARGEEELPPFASHVVTLDEDRPVDGSLVPPFAVGLDDPAYVLFTSGSTGQPKGVVVGHRGLANLAVAQADAFGVTTADRVLSFASFAFDAFVSEVGMALVTGATLDLGAAQEAPRDAVLDTLAERRITVVTLPPSLLRVLDPRTRGGLPHLRALVSAGEPLFEATARAWAAPGRRLWNAYGPTECTVCATIHAWAPSGGAIAEDVPSRVPIGTALAHTRLAVLDEAGLPVPAGVVGELHVGGIGVAHGYLDAPELTAAAFVTRDLGRGPERVYRTGDRVRMLASGALEYLGRSDDQVKVRGVRVELAEVEWALAEHAAVAESAARVVDDRLVGYVVLRDGAQASRTEILARARERVPAGMVPQAVVVLPRMPRTATGKVDRARLPEPELDDERGTETHVAPHDGLEATIATLWGSLLRARAVSRDADFFALGGHSLVALQVAARLRDAVGVEPPVSLVFEHPRLAAFADAVASLRGASHDDDALVRIARDGPLPLSFAEERLWLLEQLQPGTSAYGLTAAFRLVGPLDRDRLARAVTALLERHEILRTTYVADGGRPRVLVGPAHPGAWRVVDLADEASVAALVDAAAREPFALDRAPLARFVLGRRADDDHVLVVTMHHALADAWSTAILLSDLARAYGGEELGEARLGYVDFAAWQRRAFASGKKGHLLEGARARLAGAPLLLDLPVDRSPPAEPSARAERARMVLDPSLAARVASAAEAHRATPFMVYLAAFLVVLERWTGTHELVVGTPSARRPRAELEDVVGNFLGSLVIRADLGGAATVGDVLARTRAAALAAFGDEDLPFEHLAQALAPPRALGRNPVFQVLFSMTTEGARAGATPSLAGVTVTPLEAAAAHAKVDLSLGIGPHREGLEAVLEFRVDRFDPETAALVLDAFAAAARALASTGDDAPTSVLAEAVAGAWRPALARANATDAPALGTVPFTDRVRAVAAASPRAIAVEQEGHAALTYEELVAEAERVAASLRGAGVAPGDRVGIAMGRSPRLVATLLGVLLARAAYVPLPAGLPGARLEAMRTDAGIRLVLDDAWRAKDGAAPDAPQLDDLAYVLFTSGSTGRPKGVAVEHGALANLLASFAGLIALGPADRWLAVTPLSFDIAGLELWGPLAVGATVVLATEEEAADGAKLAHRIATARPTVLQATPATYRMLLAAEPHVALRDARLLVGGEVLTATLARELHARAAALWNVYGPTETTIWSTALRVTEAEIARGGWVALGTPIANTRVSVVDEAGQPLPLGAVGELVIEGRGVARGYVAGDPTSAFVDTPRGRAYRTGDRARVRWDGALVFEGRGDGQVKLRGHRIELGDVEAHLEAHPALAEAVVAVEREGEDAWLVAHVVPREGHAPSESDLRAWLGERLAAPMVPTWIALQPALPRTPNGKIDRRALPALAPARRAGPALAEAATPSERVLATLFDEVLGTAGAGPSSDFFALGGHSLVATELVARVRATMGAALPLRAVFEAPTVSALAKRIDALGASAWAAIPRRAHDARTVPSYAQERMWLLARLEPGAPTYHLPAAVRIGGPLDVALLAEALSCVVARHVPLHTTFVLDGDGLVAVPREPAPVLLVPEPCGDAEVEARIAALAATPFDLERGPVLRAALFRLADDEHVLALVVHHIAADAASVAIATTETATFYEALRLGRVASVPDLAIDYLDFARWQRTEGRGAIERDLAYWTRTLAEPEPCEVLPDRPRTGPRAPAGAVVTRSLDASFGAEVTAFAQTRQSTLFVVALAALDVVLARFAGTLDVRVGTPIGRRTSVELEPLVGPFLETLVLRTSLAGAPSVDDLLARARDTALDAFAHASVPFDELVRALAPERDLTRTPLFQAMLLVHPAPRRAPATIAGLVFEPVPVRPTASAFELTFAVTEHAGGALDLALEYRADLFEASTAARLLDALARVLTAIPRTRGQTPARELPVLDEAVVLRGPPARPFVAVPHAVERARRDAVAVVGPRGASPTTYDELSMLARRVASTLASLGVGREGTVALELRRSPRLVAAILGVWRAGAAYVPLDRAWPDDRKRWIAADARTSARIDDAGITVGARHVRWDELAPDDGSAGAAVTADALAYVLYTSGSTGTPKGVAVTQGNVANLAATMASRFALGPGDRVLQFASASFDASLEEILPTLVAGATLVLRDDEGPGTIQAFLDDVESAGVTVLDLPTALWHTWVDERPERVPPCVRLVVVGGEAATLDRLAAFRAGPGGRVTWLNTYGPTETTVTATAYELPPGAELPGHVSIGGPIDGVSARVVAADGALVGVGCPGELLIGGAGVARGYVSAPELTAARFVELDGERVYRTGDRVRLRDDGGLEFLGRVDEQIKIRGHRVEPGEIEAALRADAQVTDAAVIASGGALVAYVVARDALDVRALRAALAGRLPAALVPAAFVALPSLPRTTAGKLDRRRLPAVQTRADGARVVLPRTDTERELAALWRALLGLGADVSIDDDFFALGGHSLLATQLLSRVRDRFGVDLPLRTVFEASTVAALAARIASGDAATGPIARRTDGDAPPPLSFAQERLFFLDRLEPGSAFYNLPMAVRLDGPLDEAALARALGFVWDRHDVLRSSFEDDGGRARQRIAPAGRFEVPIVSDEESEVVRAAEREATTPFDLARGPLVRARLHRLAPERHVLVAVLHHIVADGWSTAVLLREVATAYAAFAAGRSPELPPLPIQYADFAAWQRARFEGGALERGLRFFEASLAGAPALLELPTDRPRPRVQSFAGDDTSFVIDAASTTRLRAFAAARGATPFMVLLAALDAVLGRLAGTKDVLVGASVANRTRAELEPLIGFFVNILVLRADLAAAGTFDELVAQVRARTLAAMEHEDVPFDRVVDALAPERSLGHSPLFQVNFVLQNAPVASVAVPGVTLQALPVSGRSARFDLIVSLEEAGDGLLGTLTYRTDLFDRTTAERFARAYVTLLAGALDAPDAPLAGLPLLARDERARALANGAGPVTTPRAGLLTRAVEAIAAAHPTRVAVAYRDQSLTYGELDARANRLARLLGNFGVGRGVRVAIAAGREPARIVGVLAVLKAGASYVPIDERNPPARVAAMLEDATASVVLATEALADVLPAQAAHVVVLEEHEAALAAFPSDPLTEEPALDDEAYVMFTSGSTGRPKGVRVLHRGILNLAIAQRAAFGVSEADRVLQLAAFGFDASLSEIAMALTSGAVLDLGEGEDLATAEPIEALVARRAVTVATLPPTLLARMDPARAPGLRVVVSAGEALDPAVARPWLAAGRALLNAYGPTEATVCATVHRVTPADLDGRRIPIGRPIDNVTTYVVDEAFEPALPGVVGEIVVGGVGLAVGYLDGDRTRFVTAPWGEPLYRTGDRGRVRADGVLEIVGRDDAQVKLRGQRVELGEIEHVLLGHPSVAQAAVVVRDDVADVPVLVAYVVTTDDLDEAALRAFAKSRLPAYMVPAQHVRLPALPANASGKVDRSALPHPGALRGVAQAPSGFVAPRSETERAVAETWATLLGRERVSVTDSFFELGGDSILSLQAVARLAQRGLRVTAKQIFERPTVEGLAAVAVAADAAPAAVAMDAEGEHTPTPLQEGLLFHALYAEGSAVYVSQLSCRIDGPLDPAALRAAWRAVVRRHAALRTAFAWGPGGPVARVVRDVDVPLEVRVRPSATREEIDELAAAERARGIDVTRAPLFRLLLVRVGPEHHELVFTHHHLVLDGWSVAIVLREVVAFALGADADALPPALAFRAYAEWLASRDLTEADRFFGSMLGEVTAPTRLGFGRDVPAGHAVTRVAERSTRLDAATTKRLELLARTGGTTTASVVTAAWAEVLGRHARAHHVVVGVTIAGRPAELPGAEGAVGLYINTLPVRIVRAPSRARGAWLADVQRVLADLREVGHTPLARAQARSGIGPKDALFESIVVFENFPVGGPAGDGAGSLRLGDVRGAEQTSYPLTVVAAPGPELELRIAYDADRFEGRVVEDLLDGLARVVAGLAQAPDEPVAHIAMIAGDVEARTAALLRGPAVDASPPLLTEAFLACASRTPEALAAFDVATGERVTYAALAERAATVAAAVGALGADPLVVAVALPRSIDLVAALLGVAWAGGTFVPLDPTHPEERLRFQLADAGASAVLAQRATARIAGDVPTLLVEDLAPTKRPAARALASNAPAYVLYTSGSTGKPKGVLVEHGPLARYLAFARRAYRIGEGEGAVVHTSVAFDLTVTSLLAPLTAGGHVVLAPPGEGIDPLVRALDAVRERVALLKMTPGHAALLASELAGAPRPLARAIVLGGEALSTATVRALAAIDPEAAIDNEYGPTEAVVGCVVHRADPTSEDAFVPIGRPIDGVELAIVDADLASVPPGAVGELLVGGASLARGYVGRPEETAARFLELPRGGRFYRTGDLVRLRADGVLLYLGREDDQVKVRGHRIELGEVEAALLGEPRLREAAVVLEGESDAARLVAYVVAPGLAPEDARALTLDRARRALPAAFVPSRVVVVDALPLAPSGKVDRARLATTSHGAPDATSTHGEPPRTDRERALAAIWRDVLGVADVTREDDFFLAGGDSILALQVIARLAAQGLRLTPRRIFEHPTLAAMAAAVTTAASAAPAADPPGPVPLTPIQRWFFAGGRARPEHYNQSLLLACRVPVALEDLERVVRDVLDHHGLLRVRFVRDGEAWSMERTLAPLDGDLVRRIDLAAVTDGELASAVEQRCGEVQASLDLEAGRLARVLWIDAGAERPARLLLVVHHLVVDAVSWRVLLGDLELAFAARARGESPTLPPVTGTFPAFARALERHAVSPELLEELPYWEAIARAAPHEAPPTRGRETRTHRAAMRFSATANVHERLLAALTAALATGGRSEHLVDVEGHGREEIPGASLDLSRAVGWFTSLYPVLLRWDARAEVDTNARAVAERLRAVPRSGFGYGVLRWMHPDASVRERLARARADVSFNYLGQLDGVLDATGPFAPAREGRGAEEAAGEPSPHALAVNAFVAGGELVVEWTYAPDVHDAAAVERMARTFFDTVRAIASTPARASATDELVVCLRPGETDAPPLFLVHPVGGLVGCYAELARAMGGGRAIYGLQAVGVDGRAPLLTSLPAMAERYARAVHSVASGRPYVLGGWSMGAIVAHAMASGPAPGRVGPLVAIDQTPAEVRRELDDAALLVEIVGDAIPLEPSALRTLSVREQVRLVLDEARRRNLPIAGLDEEDVQRHLELCKTNFRALATYEPVRSTTDVFLVRAEARPDWEPKDVDPAAEWRRFTSGRVEVHGAPGDHVSMTKRPHVARVALLIERALAIP